MADEKRKLLFDIAINQICWIGDSFAGTFKPASCNPFRLQEVEVLKTEQDRKLESEHGFNVLGNYLKKIAKKRK